MKMTHFKNNKYLFKFLIFFFTLGLAGQTINAQVSTEEIKAMLIVQFCDNVVWADPPVKNFTIGCYTDDESVCMILESVRNRVSIQNLSFDLITVHSAEDIKKCNAVFYSRSNQKDLIEFFNKSRDNNVLLITDNYTDQLFVMINIINDADKVTFKINMPNLTIAGFTIHPNLLLNGGSVVDIKSAYIKFESQIQDKQKKLEETRNELLHNEELLTQRDNIIKQKESEIGSLGKEIKSFKDESKKLIAQVNEERLLLDTKTIELAVKDSILNSRDIKLHEIFENIEKKQAELSVLKGEIANLRIESDSLKININTKNITLTEKENAIKAQKKLIVLYLAFIGALIFAAFLLIYMFITKKRHNVELEEKVNSRTLELQQKSQQYLSLFNLAPVAIWEMDLSNVKNHLISLDINDENSWDAYVSTHPEFVIECFRKIHFINVNNASLELYGISEINELYELYEYTFSKGLLTNLINELKLILFDSKTNNFNAERFNRRKEKLDVYISWLNISTEPSNYSRILLTMVDITHLRRVETELRKYQEHLELLVKERTLELDTANKELGAANEEYQVINEELFLKNKIINDNNIELNLTLEHLKETQFQLIQSEKMASLGVLTAGVAHEINNPLNFIMGGFLGLEKYFERDDLPKGEKIDLLLSSIKTGIERASTIVKSLNQFSRKNETFDENCDLHGIIDNCLVMLNNSIKNRIQVKKLYSAKNIVQSGNIGKMHQIFLNILNNSVQSIKNEGVITITTNQLKGKTIVEIADTGCGISKENLSKVIDPFFTTKEPGIGTGLGLSITYNIIKEHKGELLINSEVNKGTKIKVIFPINN